MTTRFTVADVWHCGNKRGAAIGAATKRGATIGVTTKEWCFPKKNVLLQGGWSELLHRVEQIAPQAGAYRYSLTNHTFVLDGQDAPPYGAKCSKVWSELPAEDRADRGCSIDSQVTERGGRCHIVATLLQRCNLLDYKSLQLCGNIARNFRKNYEEEANSITVNGKTRSYMLYVPANCPAGAPLVIAMHKIVITRPDRNDNIVIKDLRNLRVSPCHSVAKNLRVSPCHSVAILHSSL